MKNNKVLIQHKTEVKKSPIHGYGVFAKEDIKKDDIIEECHFMSMHPLMHATMKRLPIARYTFSFPKSTIEELIWPFGNGCIFNSSPTPNADWNTDTDNRLIIFVALKDIKKGEEMFTNYESSITYYKKQGLI